MIKRPEPSFWNLNTFRHWPAQLTHGFTMGWSRNTTSWLCPYTSFWILCFSFLIQKTTNIPLTLLELWLHFLPFSCHSLKRNWIILWSLSTCVADQVWTVIKVKLSCCKLVFPHGERKLRLLFDVILCIFFTLIIAKLRSDSYFS